MRPFTLEGAFGHSLDAEENGLDLSRVHCFETEDLMGEVGLVLPVLTYLFHRLDERFDGRPTLLILDEAWVFLDNPLFAARIREWLIAFTLAQTEAAFKAQFPSSYTLTVSASGLALEAQTRWQSAMAAYQQTLMVQSRIDEALQTDAGTLNDLLKASEASEGSLQAQQASNQLAALSAKQQMQIQTLMAAQYRAEAIDAARKAQGEAAAKVATKKFLGSGKAYTAQ